jgi:uncharacterized protein
VEILARSALSLLSEYRSIFRVVIVNGPRQSGKSTLLGLDAKAHNAEVLSLDNPAILRAARTDPTGFIAAAPKPLYLDEVQRGGDQLILAIKADVDANPTERGRFILSGSSKFLSIPTLSESLAGRAGIIDLWPLAQSEFEGSTSSLIDLLFASPHLLREVQPPALNRSQIMDRVVRGGFPEVADLAPRARGIWFDAYLRTIFERELEPLLRTRQTIDIRRAGSLLAARTAQEMNVSSFATTLGNANAVTTMLLELLESIFFHFSLPGWTDSVSARVRRRPKIHLVDSGITAHLRRQSIDQLRNPIHAEAGALVETFVVGEILRAASWSEVRPFTSHFRDSEQREVDLILETPDGRVIAIEVKTAMDVDNSDFRWLTYLRDRLGERFLHGLVVHLGDRPLPFGDRLTALPISTLWRLG